MTWWRWWFCNISGVLLVHNGAHADTWYGLDLGMWVAARRKRSVPERPLDAVEATIRHCGEPISLFIHRPQGEDG